MAGEKKIFPSDASLRGPAILFGQIGVEGEETYLPIKVLENEDGTCTLQTNITIGEVTIGAVKIEDANSNKKLEILGDGENIAGITGGFQGITIMALDVAGNKVYFARTETIGSKWRILTDATLKDGAGNVLTSTLVDTKRALDVNMVAGDIEIGAVELKNAADDTRAVIKTDGTDNALVVIQNNGAKETSGNLAGLATHQTDGTQKTKISNGTIETTITTVDSKNALDVNMVAGDIEIGAVELKNAADDTRAVIKTDGTDNALVVIQNNGAKETSGNLANLATHQTDGTQKTKISNGTIEAVVKTDGTDNALVVIQNNGAKETSGNLANLATHQTDGTQKTKISNGTIEATITTVDSKNAVDVNMVAGDIEIGAVEIKNATDDTRVVVRTDGTENALVTVENTTFTKLAGSVDLSAGAMDVVSTFAKKKKIVGIYINISTAKARNITISIKDTTTTKYYTVVTKTADSVQSVIITDEFITPADMEVRIEISQAVAENATVNYRIDVVNL